jgi:hypothetical protein
MIIKQKIMNKSIIIFVAIIIVVGAVFLFWQKSKTEEELNQMVLEPESSLETGAFEKGNPFEVDINPVSAYQNPFAR